MCKVGADFDSPRRFVPQQTAWVVERMGRFHRILDPGLAILVPIVDKIQYVKSLKEVAIEIPSQSAITADNVTLDLDASCLLRLSPPPVGRLIHHLGRSLHPCFRCLQSLLRCRRRRVCHFAACPNHHAIGNWPAHPRPGPKRACGS